MLSPCNDVFTDHFWHNFGLYFRSKLEAPQVRMCVHPYYDNGKRARKSEYSGLRDTIFLSPIFAH